MVSKHIKATADGAGLLFTAFLIGKHVANGDVQGLGFDALNLYMMPKIGERLTAKMTAMAEDANSMVLRSSAPIIGRAVGNFAAFLGLYQAIRARESAKDDVDRLMADVNIVSNGVFISADVPAVISEVASSMGAEVGLIGELAGPVGSLVSVGAIITAEFIEAALNVKKIDRLIRLTSSERKALYWRFFLGSGLSEEIRDDLEVEALYERFFNAVLKTYNDNFDRIFISRPKVVERFSKIRMGGKNAFFKPVCRNVITKSGLNVTSGEFVSSADFDLDPSWSFSRVLPKRLHGGYETRCGPIGENDVRKILVDRVVYDSKPYESEECANGSQTLLETFGRKFYIGESPPHCHGGVIVQKVTKFRDSRTCNGRVLHSRPRLRDSRGFNIAFSILDGQDETRIDFVLPRRRIGLIRDLRGQHDRHIQG